MGLVVAHEPLSLIDVQVHSSTGRTIAEITLALVLFSDASRVNMRALRSDLAPPVRLLGIGLPLTIAAGAASAAALFGGIDPWVAALIGAIVASTDAALGASILQDERVPARVRRVLNVESGLNDGIATPFVNLFIAGAVAAEVVHAQSVGGAAVDLLIGVGVGAGVGLIGAALLRTTRRLGWSAPAFRQFAVLGLALVAYAVTIQASGNGFVGAFVGGLAFGSVTPAADDHARRLHRRRRRAAVAARRVGILQRWLTILGTIVGVVLLVTIESFAWVTILFPCWVLILSMNSFFILGIAPQRDPCQRIGGDKLGQPNRFA